MPVVPVPTPHAPAVAGPYSPAVRAGDWLVLAGQVGLDPTTGAIVDDCAASMSDVAKTTVFVTDISSFGSVNAVYADVFGTHRPARSTVQVGALPGGAHVEIEVWAYVPTTADST